MEEVEEIVEERGPYWVTQTVFCVFSVDQRRCNVNEACCTMAASALSLHVACVCVCACVYVYEGTDRDLFECSEASDFPRFVLTVMPGRLPFSVRDPSLKPTGATYTTQMWTYKHMNGVTWKVKMLSQYGIYTCPKMQLFMFLSS